MPDDTDMISSGVYDKRSSPTKTAKALFLTEDICLPGNGATSLGSGPTRIAGFRAGCADKLATNRQDPPTDCGRTNTVAQKVASLRQRCLDAASVIGDPEEGLDWCARLDGIVRAAATLPGTCHLAEPTHTAPASQDNGCCGARYRAGA